MDNLLNQKIGIEIENIEKVLSIIKKHNKKIYSELELAGIATYIHNFYNGIENIIKQILKSKRINLSNSSSWHRDMLLKSKEENIINDELYDKLLKFLSFRHFFVHSYSFILDKDELNILIDSINDVWMDFRNRINNYLK